VLHQNIYIYVQGVSRVRDITGGNCFLDLSDQKKVAINMGVILKYYRALAVFKFL